MLSRTNDVIYLNGQRVQGISPVPKVFGHMKPVIPPKNTVPEARARVMYIVKFRPVSGTFFSSRPTKTLSHTGVLKRSGNFMMAPSAGFDSDVFGTIAVVPIWGVIGTNLAAARGLSPRVERTNN